MTIKIRDIVEAVSPFALVCGSGRYDDAIVVSVAPLAVVSRQGDMLWMSTVYPEKLRVIGRATDEEFEKPQHRWAGERGPIEKRNRRTVILSQIETKRGMVKVLQKEARDLAESLGSEWVIRSRQLRQRVSHGGTGAPAGSESYYGSRNPGTQWLVQGFIYSNPQVEGVQVFSHPDSALFAAQCAADRDRKYLDKWYVVEVVDRLDGEVYDEITTRSDYANEVLGQYPPKGK